MVRRAFAKENAWPATAPRWSIVVGFAALSLCAAPAFAQSANARSSGQDAATTATANDEIDTTTEPADQSTAQQRRRMRDIAKRFARDNDTDNQQADTASNAPAASQANQSQRAAQARPDHRAASTGQAAVNNAADQSSAAAQDDAAKSEFEKRRDQKQNQPLGGSPDQDASGGSDSGWTVGGGWVLETLTALGLVISLILLGRWAWIKLSGQSNVTTTGSAAGTVEVLSRTAVAPKNHVLLLRVGNRVLVVGDSANGLNTLTEVEDPDEVAEILTNISAQQPTSITSNFRSVLSRVSGHFDQRTLDQEEGRDDAEHHFDRSRSEVSSLLSRLRSMTGRGGRP